jgi:hypothetical protein
MKQEVANILIETICRVYDANVTNNEKVNTSDLVTVNNVYFKVNIFRQSHDDEHQKMFKLIKLITGTSKDNDLHKDYNLTYLFSGQFLLTLRIEA